MPNYASIIGSLEDARRAAKDEVDRLTRAIEELQPLVGKEGNKSIVFPGGKRRGRPPGVKNKPKDEETARVS